MAIHFRLIQKKASNVTKDMTVGEPLKLIFLYSIPLLLGNIIQQLYSMADTIIVGQFLGTNALAAVGTTGPMNFLVLGFISGLTSGFAVITAQQFGAKDENGLKRSVAMNVMLNLIFSITITIIAIVTAKPILRLINTPSEIFEDAATYIIIIYIGIVAIVLYNGTACILRALGDSKSPLYFLIISAILNIVLDIVFISCFDMGVAGAAWATVVSQGLAGVASLIYMIVKFPILRIKKSDFLWNNWFAWQHLRIGLPMAFQFSITAIGVIVLQGALNVFGATKIAAYTAAQKVEQLVAVAAGTFGVTMANYTGQNLGAKRLDRIKDGTNKCCILTVVVSLISMAISLLFSDQMTSLFINANADNLIEVLDASREYLHLTALFYPALFVIFIYRNVLQSMGKGFMPLMAGVFELIARTLAAYTLPFVLGYKGICLAGPLAWLVAAIPLFIAYSVIIRRFKV